MSSKWRAPATTLAIALFTACASATPPAQTPSPIRVEKGPPPPGACSLGELTVVDGHGCGLFGTLGTYDGAVARLRAQAYARGADFVQITSVKEPHPDRECVQKEYTITGVAYRVAPAPAPPLAPAPPPSATTAILPAPPSAATTAIAPVPPPAATTAIAPAPAPGENTPIAPAPSRAP